jgi:hypothetical protein
MLTFALGQTTKTIVNVLSGALRNAQLFFRKRLNSTE